jgi:GxxExxY protein
MNDIESIARNVVNSAIKVHKALGPGLLESVYQRCLAYELEKAGESLRCEVVLPVQYETIKIDMGFRADMIVADLVIVENKTVDKIVPIHEAQLLTYLKLTRLPLGFLLNWNVPLMKDGIRRMVNGLNEWKRSQPPRPPRPRRKKPNR